MAIAALMVGCSGFGGSGGVGPKDRDSGSRAHKPYVLATSTILRNWAEEVAQDQMVVESILKPGEDPHVYEPVPRDTIRIEKADLILYNGFNLEPGLIKLIQSSGDSAKTFAVGEVVPPLDYQKAGTLEPDPHVWGSVQNAIMMVNAIRDRLIQLSPADQAQLTQNALALTQELEQLDQWVKTQIATIPPENRQIVTTHDAFQYYSKAYGLKILGTLIGISTEEQPSAQTLKNLAQSIRNAGVPQIFAETTINPDLIKTVAEEAGVKLAEHQLYSDSLGAASSGADTYIKMIAANTKTLVEALGGTFTPFEYSGVTSDFSIPSDADVILAGNP